jgi:hypothetical protein
VAVIDLARPQAAGIRPGNVRTWLASRWEVAWFIPLLAIAGVAHAWNMFDFPYYENDEGTYVSQAWAVFHAGQIASYTYWYDHPPLGWIQLGFLSTLLGGFNVTGNSVTTGRLMMLAYQIGAVSLLYRISRSSGRTVAASTIAVLAFSLSAYGLYLHRRVLLDNVATFWLLAAFALVLAPRLSLTRVWLSAISLGIGILSKEIVVITVPAVAFLVARQVDRPRRAIALVGWLAVVGAIASTWLLLAVLKGELFPTGTVLGGTNEHVSLIGTILAQAARGKDGGLLDAQSAFWRTAETWVWQDPLLVIVGTFSSLLALTRWRSQPAPAAIGFAAVLLLLFLGRGGVTLGFYLLPVLPLLALGVAWIFDALRTAIARPVLQGRRFAFNLAAASVLLPIVIVGTAMGYRDTVLGYRSDPLQLWTSRQAEASRDAIAWVRATIPAGAGIVTDMYPWLDLHDPPPGAPAFDLAHWYWKLGLDPEIRDGVFSGDWREIQYMIVTHQMITDAHSGQLPLVKTALENSTPFRSFDTGGWPVVLERVNYPQSWTAADDRLLSALWERSKLLFLANGRAGGHASARGAAALQSMVLLQSVYMADRAAFDAAWTWTKTNLASADGRIAAKPASARARASVGFAGPRVDTDVAVALAFASARWDDAAYRAEARRLIDTIWDRETVPAKGGRLVVPGWPANVQQSRVSVDLAAISPYAYRIFGKLDRAHRWSAVVNASYRFLADLQVQAATGGRAGLLPRWAAIEPRSGRALATAAPGKKENLFDAGASQVGWRVGLDWLWNRDERAQRLLRGLFLPREELERKGWLGRAYHLNGQPVDGMNTIATYSTALPTVLFGGKVELASGAFTKFVLAPVVAPDSPDAIGGTDRAWAWFGTALMDGALVDLTTHTDRIDWSTVSD